MNLPSTLEVRSVEAIMFCRAHAARLLTTDLPFMVGSLHDRSSAFERQFGCLTVGELSRKDASWNSISFIFLQALSQSGVLGFRLATDKKNKRRYRVKHWFRTVGINILIGLMGVFFGTDLALLSLLPALLPFSLSLFE